MCNSSVTQLVLIIHLQLSYCNLPCVFQIQEFEGKDTALLIDRYKYADLFPCSPSELKALGYYVSLLSQTCFCFSPYLSVFANRAIRCQLPDMLNRLPGLFI